MESRPVPSSVLVGQAVLDDALTNRGTAFTDEERDAYGLRGMLPPAVETLEEQVARCHAAFLACADPVAQLIYLRQLQDTNEVLFYRLVTDHVSEMLPVVYTPTVGEGCRRFSEIYRRPRGLFLSYADRGRIRELLANRPHRDVDVIVVTDGQRILGLGDLGANGMGIPIGKLSLYTAVGGIDPARTLPVLLDVGTDTTEVRDDPRYLGWRHKRVTGSDYDDFVTEFVDAVRAELPDVLLQWEDFATAQARPILERYRDTMLTFNDDIQGTAAVVLGALTSAARLSKVALTGQRVVMVGAGSAAIGVLDMVREAMVRAGLSEDEARGRIWVVDVDGLLTTSRRGLSPEQQAYARDADELDEWTTTKPSLIDVIENVAPTTLVGLSTVGGLFDEEVVSTMAGLVDRPIILPLSNPTSSSEADPADLMTWTGGLALVATGSPYPPVEVDGVEVEVAQSNNVYVFPAIGLAVTAARATRVTDSMLVAAATELGAVAAERATDDPAPLLPPVSDLPATARRVALAAALAAVEDGVAPPATEAQLRAAIHRARWTPHYA
ncbi:NAD-dependent malic enzyme [Marmoricola endophyticus]|uniref:Putative malate oxidoreductase [NAD] n=1 Tax=Marmoricola endophyticus TaxID=2040280 RepID=A0A917EY95_9ACTN|nr:NAD-dependent malic enzyme [Marmoricola endophyticus]GGF31663.1 NAD-dependent malic enzyme [Marmoricola endophyticus]